MVAPFSPYSRTITRFYPGTERLLYSFSSSGTKQKPPYVSTALTVVIQEVTLGELEPNMSASVNSSSTYVEDEARVIATNVARGRLVGKLGDTSSIGATLFAERRATYGMLKSFVVDAFLAARAVKRGDLVKAARILGTAPPEKSIVVKRKTRKGKRTTSTKKVLVLPNGRQVSQSLGNKWLWYSYGVKPLCSDMYNSVDVLQRDTPWTRVEGSGKGSAKIFTTESELIRREQYQADCKVRMSVDVRVSNPNLFLANQLGLTNPVQWLNEAIMFSFVIDWFSNLSQVISQMTDFAGLETNDPITGTKTVSTRTYDLGRRQVQRTLLTRELLIPSAKLRFAYERFQWQRGANAISLLVQFLKKG